MSKPAENATASTSNRLSENIPTRPFLRRRKDIAANILNNSLRAAIVNAARRKAELRKVEFTEVMEAALVEKILSAIGSFFSDWRGRMNDEEEMTLNAIEYVDTALAMLIGTTFTFGATDVDVDENDTHNTDIAGAYEWLQDSLNGIQNREHTPHDFFMTNNVPSEVHDLWLSRESLIAKHQHLYERLDTADVLELTPRVYTSSRLNSNIQQLIGDLCEAWRPVDPDIGLPDANANPDNPLLRYLDAVLNAVLADQRPSKKTVLDFVKRQWKPNWA